MNKYVQAPISRIPSGDLASSGMSFMQEGPVQTGGRIIVEPRGALGSNPRTWPSHLRLKRPSKGKGCKSCRCNGRGLYA